MPTASVDGRASDPSSDDGEGHRGRVPPGVTNGKVLCATNPTFVARAVAVAGEKLGAAVVLISRSTAGGIGIAAIAPSASCSARAGPPEVRESRKPGAGGRREKGTRSGGARQRSCPVNWLRRDRHALRDRFGVSPVAACPKLMLGRSSAIDSTESTSMSTGALCGSHRSAEVARREHGVAEASRVTRGQAAAEKSLELASVSVPARPRAEHGRDCRIAGAAPRPFVVGCRAVAGEVDHERIRRAAPTTGQRRDCAGQRDLAPETARFDAPVASGIGAAPRRPPRREAGR